MYFDGAWEILEDGCMEYENENVIAFCLKKDAAFCFKKDATFEQLGNYSRRPNIASESTICTIIF